MAAATRDVRALVAGIALVAVAAAAATLLLPRGSFATSEALVFGAGYAAVFLAAQRLGFLLHWRGLATRVSIEEFALVGGLLLLPAPLLVLSVGAAVVAHQAATRRPVVKAAFNAGQYVLGVSAAALAFAGLVAAGAAPLGASLAGPVVFAVVSQGLTALLFARLERQPALHVFRTRFLQWTAITSIIGVSLGIAAFALWSLHPVLVLGVVPIFLLLARFGRLTEWAEEEVRVHKALAEASTRMAATGDFDVVADAILETCANVFSAGEARLTVALRGAPKTWGWIHEQGAGAHGMRVVVPTPAGEPGELVIYPRPGQRHYGTRDRYLLTMIAASAASALSAGRSLHELREANQRLSNANRELEEFTLWTTHDMREPLRSVAQLAQILREDIGQLPDDESRDLALRIEKGADTLKDRIKALHEFSRVVQEDVPFETVDLGELFAHARADLAAKIAERGGVVICHGELPVVRAQPQRFGKVICNLVENALKHNDKSRPVVEIRAFDRGHEWELSVRDNGPGIDPGFRERAFKLFQRGPGAKESGSGAGLAIVKRIVEQHGGRIWIEPASIGGADLRFTVPKASAALLDDAASVVEVRVRDE